MRRLWRSDYPLPPAQWTTTRFSNGCATTGFDCFEGSRQAARLFFNYSVVISAPSRGLTQTVTQTRKKAGGYRRTQWIAHRAESAQKGRKALDTNAFRPSSYLHTQEVTGSSPAVSTKRKPWNHNGSGVFSLPFSGRKEPLCLRYFGVFSGNFGASCCKSVANFFGPLSVVPQGFAAF